MMCLTPQILNCHNTFTGMDTEDNDDNVHNIRIISAAIYVHLSDIM